MTITTILQINTYIHTSKEEILLYWWRVIKEIIDQIADKQIRLVLVMVRFWITVSPRFQEHTFTFDFIPWLSFITQHYFYLQTSQLFTSKTLCCLVGLSNEYCGGGGFRKHQTKIVCNKNVIERCKRSLIQPTAWR